MHKNTTIVPRGPESLSSKKVTVNVSKDPHRECITAADTGIRFFATGDEGIPVLGTLPDILGEKVLLRLSKLPVKDPQTFYDSADTGIKNALSTYNDSFPKYTVSWSDWNSDQTLSNIVFSGLGQYYIKAVNRGRTDFQVPEMAAYEVDLSLLVKYAVRAPFEPFGVIAYFATTRAPCGLYWCSQKKLVTRSDDTKSDSNSEYQHVSALFRSSLLLQVTIFDHLIGTHWIISNGLLLASERHLDADHPIRRLIKPHTYGAGQVNLLSTALLAPVGGFAHRAFGFDAAAYPVALCDLISLWKCETYEEHFINSGLPSDMHDSLPLYLDGLDYWNVTEKYVRSYVSLGGAGDRGCAAAGLLGRLQDAAAEQRLRIAAGTFEGSADSTADALYLLGDCKPCKSRYYTYIYIHICQPNHQS